MNLFRYLLLCSLLLVFKPNSFSQTTIVPDTTFLLRDTSGGFYHAIFIDTAKSSLYYDYINNFQLDELDSATYQPSVECLKPFTYNNSGIFGLPIRWCALHIYKQEYYLYSPSDYFNNYRISINDSMYIDYYSEGPTARKVNAITKINESNFRITLGYCDQSTNDVFIHIIDAQRGIAIFESPFGDAGNRYRLMIDANNIKDFPIIVNYSTFKSKELNFEEPDYEKLLKRK